MFRFGRLLALCLLFCLEGCTCCAYLNHMFNAERNYDEAAELRMARIDSTGNEDAKPAGEEAQKYDKVIEKGSHVLERFPKNKKRTAEAVFLIGHSYMHKREWTKAVEKYDEFERYFADHDSMPSVEYWRAYCLYKNKEYNISRFALEPVIAAGPDHPYYYEGLNLLSLLAEQSEATDEAIAALEALLADTSATPFMRGKVHFRLGMLYYDKEAYEKARTNFLAKEIDLLVLRDRYTAKTQAAECLANMDKPKEASDEYLALAKDPDFKGRLPDLLVRYGELLFAAKDFPGGISVFDKVTEDYPKTEVASRAYFNRGVHEQVDVRAYERALDYYDSSYNARPPCQWAKDSKERYDALRRLLTLQSNNDGMDSIARTQKPFFDNEFQIAELFLFKLSEVDSAVARLSAIIEASDDTAKVLRATYARAFIYDEFMNDPEQAEEYYNEIIEKYPETQYAKQAQANMGLRVTLKNREDYAHERYLAAESLWIAAEELPPEAMDQVDSAYARALVAYDSVFQEYPETRSGAQALYMTAMIYAMDPAKLDSATARFKKVREVAPKTRWAASAGIMLSGRVSTSMEEIARLKKRIEQSSARTEELSKKYYDSFSKPKEEKKEVKSKEDEILENTYNSMYDFE